MRLHNEGNRSEGGNGPTETSPPTVKMALVELAVQIAEAVRDRLYEPELMIVLDDSMRPATAIVIMPVGAV